MHVRGGASGSGSPPSDVPTHAASAPGSEAATWAATGGASVVPHVPLTELEAGTLVADCFRIEGRLGAGGMGVVYRAHHLKLDRPVALKVHRAGGPAEAHRLEREARAMARLNHPNVIAVYDVGTWGDGVFVAMEYVDGGTARSWMQRGAPWQASLAMLLRAGEGLAAAHAAGMVHRDFKPENILIGSDGRARVADFGLAQPIPTSTGATEGLPTVSPSSTQPASLAYDVTLTSTGGFAGTPAYMAPEQFGVGKVDARADVFAFCVVTWEILYGRRPFEGHSPAELLFQASTGKISARPNQAIPAEIERVLRRGLAPDASARPQSLAALLGELRRAADQKKAPGAFAVGGALVATCLVIAGGGYLAWTTLADRDGPREEATQAIVEPPPHAAVDEPVVSEAEPDDDEQDAPRPASEPLLDGRQVAALADALLHPDDIDKGALLGVFLPDEDLGENHGLIGALVEKQIADLDAPPAPIEMPERMDLAAWSGGGTLTCMTGDHIRIQGKHIAVEQAPAIQVMTGCRLHVVDSTIEAPTALSVVGGRVLLERVHIVSTENAVTVTSGSVHLDEVTTEASTATGLALVAGKAYVTNSVIRGQVAVEASARSRADLENTRIEGAPVAVRATARGRVGLRNTTHEGVLEQRAGGAIVELVDDP